MYDDSITGDQQIFRNLNFDHGALVDQSFAERRNEAVGMLLNDTIDSNAQVGGKECSSEQSNEVS